MKPIKLPVYPDPRRHAAAAASGCPKHTHLCAHHQQSSSISHQIITHQVEEFQYQSSSQQPNSAAGCIPFRHAQKAYFHRTSSHSVYTNTSATATVSSLPPLALQSGRNRERAEAKTRDYDKEKKMSDGKGKDQRRKESGTKKITNRRGGEDTGPKEKERILPKKKEEERRTGHGADGAKEETKKKRVQEVHRGNRGRVKPPLHAQVQVQFIFGQPPRTK